MTRPSTYFDYNATAPALPQVAEAVARVMTEGGNPSSVHSDGRRAQSKVDDARQKVATLVGSSARDIIFTGGGTEANTLGLKGLISSQNIERLLVSATEHPSILDLARSVSIEVEIVPVDRNGLVELDAFRSLLEGGRTTLVSVMLANNETGVIQPVRELAGIAKSTGAFFHTDAIQAAGKIPVNFKDFGVDMLSVSAHKFAGPQGVGALVLRSGLELAPLTHGGGQELGRRSGTENVAGIVGMGVAAEIVLAKLHGQSSTASLRDSLEAALKAAAPEAVIVGEDVPRLPNTTLVALPNVAAETQVIQMDLAGFSVSSGSACSSGKVSRSHVLDAMNLGDELTGSAMRISLGWGTSESEVAALLDVWTIMRSKTIQSRAQSHENTKIETLTPGDAHVAG